MINLYFQMKKITINTTQNVKIEYELASLRDRGIAWFIDKTIIGVAIVLVSLLAGILGIQGDGVVYFVIVPIVILYTLLMEILNHGQTLGKASVGIKVVRLDGKHPELLDFIIRWAFRMIDIWFTLCSLAAIYVNSTEKAQRLGGLVSNTVVIRVRARSGFELSKLMEIETLENYTLTYPKVNSYFNEADMIIIKKVIDRANKYPNEAHRLALKNTVKRVENIMGISSEKPGLVFLRTILKDYIILSR